MQHPDSQPPREAPTPDAAGSDRSELELPPALVRDLGALYAANSPVPSEIDRRMIAEARRALKPGRRPARWLWAAGAAAALSAAAWLGSYAQLGSSRLHPPRLAGDLNRDGRVDILDAFALARELRVHPHGEGAAGVRGDVNGDGVVDDRDVRELARRAVALPTPSGEPAPRRAG